MGKLTKYISENYGEIFKIAGQPNGRLHQHQINDPMPQPDNQSEKLVDFGTDYFSLPFHVPSLKNDNISFNRYKDYEAMDQYPLIHDALDVIASEATKPDEDGEAVTVKSYNIIDLGDEDSIRELEILERYKRHFMRGFTGGQPLTSIFRYYCKTGDIVQVPVYNEDKSKILKYVRVPLKFVKLIVNVDTYEIVKYIVTPESENGSDKGGIPLGTGRYVKAAEYEAKDVYHIRNDPETSDNFPYGKSILDPVMGMYRRMRLLEEAIVVYWISRAPERRVYKIDMGNMQGAKAERYLNDMKNKMRRKQFYDPNTGQVDSEYNPMSMMEDIYIPVHPGGAEADVDTLPGAQNLNNLEALEYFRDTVIQGLKVPSSYLRSNKEGAVFNDGRVGLAYIQEIRFARYVQTLQKQFIGQVENYFRQYLENKGVEVDIDFYLEMTPPSNYMVYQENELIVSNISNYTQLQGMTNNDDEPVFSEEFLQEKFLRLGPDEILKNKELLEDDKKRKELEALSNKEEPEIGADDEEIDASDEESPEEVPAPDLP